MFYMKLRIYSFILAIIILCITSCSYFPEDYERSDYPLVTENPKYIQIGENVDVGLIFYPGGLVDPHSYVDFLSTLAADRKVFIAKVPYNLSILDIDLAEGIRKEHNNITEWSIMGHSLGGAVACFEVNNNIDIYKSLFLLAAYPSENTDLKNFQGRVVSMFGSNDEVIDKEKLENTKSQFNGVEVILDLDAAILEEQGTYYYEIVGGNHAYFGNYGMQNGDGEASIPRTEQQAAVIKAFEKI